eukprot:TRINITY_DN2201_c0_g1_i1.p1 TRINITY_DN2201_c0_g1~~TRINITY_DN2201_c0_g1_i1.p1  ORF type:complete len:67 (-),score=13.42 TRINITY_DN2201_c0_g1_i1:32-232(-)
MQEYNNILTSKMDLNVFKDSLADDLIDEKINEQNIAKLRDIDKNFQILESKLQQTIPDKLAKNKIT